MAGSDSSPLIELRGISRIYGSGNAAVRALDGIDLSIAPGEFVAVMGPSGSGKSTCMNVIGFLDTPTGGRQYFDGVDVHDLSRDQRALLRRHYLGFVFQGFNLLHRTSALENVELPLVYRRLGSNGRRALAMDALARVGLADRARSTPGELSGGQQQRVAIARAIVTRPKLLLADEPTGNLDSARSAEIMDLLAEFNASGITVIVVTHDADVASYARRRISFLDGRIVADEARASTRRVAR